MYLYSSKSFLRAGCGSIFIYSLLVSSLALAVPPNGGEILQQEQQVSQSSKSLPKLELKSQKTPSHEETQGPKIKVLAFRFTGDTDVLPKNELAVVVRNYIGQELTFGQLDGVADQVSQYLRVRGYAFARAYLVAQQVKDGVVEITIFLGRIEKAPDGVVIKTDKTRIQEATIRRILEGTIYTKDDPYLNIQRLQRGLLLLNSLPGVSARASLEPGNAPDTARILTDVAETHLVETTISTDDFGNRYTGLERYNSQFNINDPFGHGDQIAIQTTSAESLDIERIGYNMPIGYDGLRLGTNYTNLYYKIGKEFTPLDAHGIADMGNVNLSYPLILTEKASLYTAFDYDYKALRDESQGITIDNKRLNVGSLNMYGNSRDDFCGGALNTYNMMVSFGSLNLDRVQDSFNADALGPRSEGGYTKFVYSVARLQHLLGDWSFFTALNGQVADKDLDSSEKFILGGPTGVRAYPTGEATGDEGWVTNLEVRYDVPWKSPLGNWQVVTFYDVGHVALYKNTWAGWNSGNSNQPNRYALSGAGFGVNLLKNKNYALRVSYAWPIGPNPGINTQGLESDGKHRSGRLWLQFEVYF